MKLLTLSALLISTLAAPLAQADVLSPRKADAICRKKAVAAAHFVANSNQPLLVSYKSSSVAEISTPITYSFTTQSAVAAGVSEPLYTVQAYAYPDDQSCTIGLISNHVAGND